MAFRVRALPKVLTEEQPVWADDDTYYSSEGIVSREYYTLFSRMVRGDPTMDSANRIAEEELRGMDMLRRNSAAFVIREKAKSHARMALMITNNDPEAVKLVLTELGLDAVTDIEKKVLSEAYRLVEGRTERDRKFRHASDVYFGEAEREDKDFFLRKRRDQEIEFRANSPEHTQRNVSEYEHLEIRRKANEEFMSIPPEDRHAYAKRRIEETEGYEQETWRRLANRATERENISNPRDPRMMPRKTVRWKEYQNSLVTNTKTTKLGKEDLRTLNSEGVFELGSNGEREKKRFRLGPSLVYYMSRKGRR